jgi:predicted PurR-regulated permease PerM
MSATEAFGLAMALVVLVYLLYALFIAGIVGAFLALPFAAHRLRWVD